VEGPALPLIHWTGLSGCWTLPFRAWFKSMEAALAGHAMASKTPQTFNISVN